MPLRAAVSALRAEFGARPENLVAAIGPSIGVCCYEVGPELVDAFAGAGHERHLIQRWFDSTPPPRGSRARNPLRLDVAGANRDQLVLAGVPEEQIHPSGLCTAMHLDVLTSYRAEKEQAGPPGARRFAAARSDDRPRSYGGRQLEGEPPDDAAMQRSVAHDRQLDRTGNVTVSPANSRLAVSVRDGSDERIGSAAESREHERRRSGRC